MILEEAGIRLIGGKGGKKMERLVVCLVLMVFGVPFCFQGGIYLLQFVDSTINDIPVFTFNLVTCLIMGRPTHSLGSHSIKVGG